MRLIEGQWAQFREKVISANASDIQLREMRRAFYAGAWAYYALVMNRLNPTSEPTGDDIQLLAGLDDEMREFGESILRGEA